MVFVLWWYDYHGRNDADDMIRWRWKQSFDYDYDDDDDDFDDDDDDDNDHLCEEADVGSWEGRSDFPLAGAF